MSTAGGPNARNGRERLLTVFDRARVARDDPARRLAARRFGHELFRRRGNERERAADLVGRVDHEVAEEADEVARHRRRPHEHAAEHDRTNLVELEVERGDDAKVAAAAAQAPEELRVLLLRRHDLTAVGSHDLGRDQVVAGEAELALEPATAAAECETRDAGARDTAAGDGEAVLLRRGVELAPGEPAFGARQCVPEGRR